VTRPPSRTALGREGEDAAARHLTALGYRILARNVRFRVGEIDLVAEEAGSLVFIEVKTRTGEQFGTAADAVTPQKQRQLVRLAELYLAGLGRERACRFDVVTVTADSGGAWCCTLYRNAFSA
jgi:putative endonuclease